MTRHGGFGGECSADLPTNGCYEFRLSNYSTRITLFSFSHIHLIQMFVNCMQKKATIYFIFSTSNGLKYMQIISTEDPLEKQAVISIFYKYIPIYAYVHNNSQENNKIKTE